MYVFLWIPSPPPHIPQHAFAGKNKISNFRSVFYFVFILYVITIFLFEVCESKLTIIIIPIFKEKIMEREKGHRNISLENKKEWQGVFSCMWIFQNIFKKQQTNKKIPHTAPKKIPTPQKASQKIPDSKIVYLLYHWEITIYITVSIICHLLVLC